MESIASELCLACGLCCRGILHPWARLQEHELETASRLGLSTGREEGGVVFYLPAVCYRDNKCSRYHETRPAICAAYRCRLLQRLLNAEISLQEALQAVQALETLVASMLQNNSSILTHSQALAPQLNCILRQQGEDVTFRHRHSSLLLEIASFRLLLKRYFFAPDVDGQSEKFISTHSAAINI